MRYIQAPYSTEPVFETMNEALSYIDYMAGPNTTIDYDEKASIVRVENDEQPLYEERIASAFEMVQYGFSKETIEEYINEEQMHFRKIDLKRCTRNSNSLKRCKGRLIGKNGRTRELMEELTGAKVKIGKNEVAILGNHKQVDAVQNAVSMIVEGAPHRTVYYQLEQTTL